MGKADAGCTLPERPMAPSRSAPLLCLLTWPLMMGASLLFFSEVFPPYRAQFRKPIFPTGAEASLLGGEREEALIPYRAFPLPHALFQGKRSCWNWLIQLFAQCLSQVFWDPEMFRGTSVERDAGVGSPKSHGPSHPQILGIWKPSLQSRSARHRAAPREGKGAEALS